MFGLSGLKLGLGVFALVLIGLAAFGLKAMVNKIDAQGREIAQLHIDLETEKAARRKDVAGLTVLSEGVLAASSARSIDEKILAETIDAKNPQPVSPGLASFLDGLRAAEAPSPATPSSGPRPAARSGAQPSRR